MRWSQRGKATARMDLGGNPPYCEGQGSPDVSSGLDPGRHAEIMQSLADDLLCYRFLSVVLDAAHSEGKVGLRGAERE